MSPRVLNYLLYEFGWCSCVLGAAFGHPWVGTVLGVVPIAAHLALTARRLDALVLTLWTAAIGLVADTTHIALGTLHFAVGTIVSWLPPPWLVLVWAQFAMTFHFGLGWLKGHPWRAALFGMLGGPLAFLAGRRLGVVVLHPDLWPSLVVLACTWGVALPSAVWLAERQTGREGIATYRRMGGPRAS